MPEPVRDKAISFWTCNMSTSPQFCGFNPSFSEDTASFQESVPNSSQGGIIEETAERINLYLYHFRECLICVFNVS